MFGNRVSRTCQRGVRDIKKIQAPEWKNTAFEWCIDRDLSLFVRNRCVFFYALGNKYIKMLNFAKKFCVPDKLVVLYLYGPIRNIDTLQRKIDEAENQLLVIHISLDAEDISAYDEFVAELKRMRASGLTEIMLRDSVKKCSEAIEAGTINDTDIMYQAHVHTLQIIERWRICECHVADAQRRPGTAYANFQESFLFGSDHDTELLGVIRKIYPCGVEANATDDFGAKRLAMKKMVLAAVDGVETDLTIRACGSLDAQQLSLFAPVNAGAQRMLDDIRLHIVEKIEMQGALSIGALMRMIRLPPYGYYECNYYAYVLAKALRPIAAAPYKVSDGVSVSEFGPGADIHSWLRKPWGIVFLEEEKTHQMIDALDRIFETGKPWAKKSFINALYSICSWCEENLQTPLGCIDRRWYELMKYDFSRYCYRDERERYFDWLCYNVEHHHRNVRRGKEIVYEKYADHAKLDLYYKFFYVKGGAVGWLHGPEMFYERIDNYMNSCVCRECGQSLESSFEDGTVYHVDSMDGELLKFTKKDVIGINKKMLGRYQEEYFCIPCLCEILDTTPDQLYEKIHWFKEQECELF